MAGVAATCRAGGAAGPCYVRPPMRPPGLTAFLVALAMGAGIGPALAMPRRPDAATGPCAAAQAPLGKRAAEAAGDALREVDGYRAAWKAACDPANAPADLAALLGEAEALVADVRLARMVVKVARALEPQATWPLPGLRRAGDGIALDWAAFAAIAERATAEDARFFRGLFRTQRQDGEPVWLGARAVPDGAPCVRLGETSWAEVTQGIEQMERGKVATFVERTAQVREALLETLQAISGGGEICGCVKGDPLVGLDALAGSAPERGASTERRAIADAARGAADALRGGRARVTWLREAPDAPATGCVAGQR